MDNEYIDSIIKKEIETNASARTNHWLQSIWSDINCIKWYVQTISISLVSIAVVLIVKLIVFPLIGI